VLTGAATVLAAVRPCAHAVAQDVPRYEDVSAAIGLSSVAPSRVTLVDLDGDGFCDLLAQEKDAQDVGNGGGPLRVFRNVADPPAPGGRRLEEVAGAVPRFAGGTPREGARERGVFAVAGDVDGDGVQDLYRAVWQEVSDHPERPDTGERSALLRGVVEDGRLRWVEVPGSGVDAGEPATNAGACFLDADRDGALDLFVGRWYVRYGAGLAAHADRLLRGDGTGRFADVTEAAGLATVAEVERADSSRPTYGVSHGDVDGDGAQDLLVATYGRQANRLWRNRGDGTFEDVADASGFDGDDERSGTYPAWIQEHPRLRGREDERPFRAHGNTFSAVPGDVDGDGDLDVFLCEITHGWAGPSSDLSALLLQEREPGAAAPRFRRVAAPFARRRDDVRRWNQGDIAAALGDLDLDGRLDVVLASSAYPDDQRLRVYRQREDGGFDDATEAFGIDLRDCHSVALADLDGDGALEVVGAGQPTAWNGRARAVAAVFRAPRPADRHAVEVVLEGAKGSNRDAIGARVWLTAGGRTQVREVVSSTGHMGLAPPRALHFGLGSAARVDRLRVRWPDAKGTEEVVEGFAADRRYRLRRGEGVLRPR
jgi:hypothetical protein